MGKNLKINILYSLLMTSFLSYFLLFTVQYKLIYKTNFRNNEEFNLEYVEIETLNNNKLKLFSIDNGYDMDILFLHGTTVSPQNHLEVCKVFSKMNLNVFTFFYRGFNRSKGKPSELTLKFDLEAVKHHLRLRNKQMIVYGQSLGGGSALYYGNLYKMSTFIVLENPFSKIINHSNNILKRTLIFFTCIDRWNNIKEIERLDSQILFLVSTKDKVVIPKNHEILVKSHNKGENKIIKFEGSGHFNVRKNPDFKPTIENFINKIKNK